GFSTELTSISSFISPVVLPNGKIIVPVRDSLIHDNVVRVNADGSLDETFNSELSEVGSIWRISLQQDGKILVASQDGNNLLRLNSNGSIDPTFNIGIT